MNNTHTISQAQAQAQARENSTPMETSSGLSPYGTGNSNNSPAASTPQDHAPTLKTAASVPPRARADPQPFVTAAGPITLDPSTTPPSTLNPRSCVTCRRRKVRCDKHMPCGNCRKAQIQCVFPAPGRAPRRPRAKDPNAPPKQTSEREVELMKRLRKLEGIVEDLSGQIEFETTRLPGGSSAGGSPEATSDGIPERERDKERGKERERQNRSANTYSENIPGGYPPADTSRPNRTFTGNSNSSVLKSPTAEVNKDFGRLVLNEKGKTRYVSNSFWSKVNDEISELRAETQQLTDEDSDDSDDGSTPATNNPYIDQPDHHGFVLGYSSSAVDLRKLHPLPSQIPFIWQVYMENVDPLVKILHIPTMDKTIRDLRSNMSDITPGLEALMFSIYYAAITSMEDEEVKTNFGAEKAHLISRYRFASEQALAKANFLTTSEVVVVQAFVLFLVLVRRYDDTRFAWTLTGLAIRIGQSLGLHRDGTHFEDLSPFDIEMRRRLWWAICVLDLRSAEDQGTELTIAERTFDAQYPLNVNDNDITPDMTILPIEKTGPTDMTFCLIRYEICSLARKMHSATSTMSPCPRDSLTTLQEREDMLLQMYERIDDKYLKTCGDKDGDLLHWVAATIARLIMAKMSLIIYQPMLMHSNGQDLSNDVRDRLFMSSVEVVEYNKILNAEPRCQQWRWLFQTYTQWHAVAYLLIEVCRRPWTASVERGWMALSATFQIPDPAETARPAVWIPLRKLMLKAKRHREQEIARLRADTDAAQKLDIDERNRVPPASFQHLPSSVRNVLAQERWRKLVGTKGPEKTTHISCGTHSGTPGEVVEAQPRGTSEEQMPQTPYQYLDHVMAQPYFNSADFFSVAFQGDTSDLSRHAFLNGGSQEMPSGPRPQQNLHVGNYGMSGSDALHTPVSLGTLTSKVPLSTESAAPSGEPMASYVDDNPPPWLWADSWSNGTQTSAAMNVPVMDDNDVNMDTDEDFNWHNWMDNGLAMGRAGFTGGI